MAIKMRVLYNSAKPKIKNIANDIKAHYELGVNAVDVIPPAYSCDKERVVIMILSAKGAHLDDSLRLFCQELTKARAQNIALMIDGNEAAANAIKEVIANVAQNNAVYDEVLYIKGGLPIIGGALKPEERTAIIEWVDRVIANLK
ncbi:MAG: hypothetical protein E7584_00360 [Ruminococcaceae bacterium]|nr:hypothetical protein [Oscillospiraceae bacterium]